MYIAFQSPSYLWLLVAIPLFAILMLLSASKRGSEVERFISFHSLEFLYKKKGFESSYIKRHIFFFLFRALLYLTVVLIISGMTLYYHGYSEKRSMVIALDNSASTIAEDILPSRFIAARDNLGSLLKKAEKGRLAILTFSGNVNIEKTFSSNFSTERLSKLEISAIPGTSLVRALETSMDLLRQEEDARKIVLISDGSENIFDGNELSKTIGEIIKENTVVDVIGIGSAEGISLPGTDIKSFLDEKPLKNIAEKTGGIYLNAKDSISLQSAFDQVAGAGCIIPVHLEAFLMIIVFIMLIIDFVFLKIV